MSRRCDGLLAAIEAGVLDDSTSLATLLQKCIVLGGHAGSERLRDWARKELNGYAGEELPGYRRLPAPLYVKVTNQAGYNPITQRFYGRELPESIQNTVKWEEVPLDCSVGELEAMIRRGDNTVQLSPSWSGMLVETLNELNTSPNSRASVAYWEVQLVSIQGVLVRVRTALAELVAELISMTPEGQAVPDKQAADQAVQLIITGDRNKITYIPQQASSGGANTLAIESPAGDSEPEHWWQRWRKRGLIISFSTFVAAVVTVFMWLGWAPW
jgi:hypothetical protein